MNWIGLVESPDHVCCRYRLSAFRPFWQAAGHTLELAAIPRGLWARLRLFSALRGSNVILQRRLLPGWQLTHLRRCARRLIFDFDDAVFLRDSYSRKGLHDRRLRQRFATTIRACDAVVAGNAFLHEHAAGWAEDRPVHLIPTCVDPLRYPLAVHQRTGPGVQMVWVGSSSTLQGLERVRPLLEEMGQRLDGLQLKVVCDRFVHFQHLPVVECSWNEDRETRDIAGADIGISWLPDDLWSRGKCGLKILQYMAAGLPVVANPIGVQREIVRHGETGFLAQTPAQWIEAIGRLAADCQLRRRMGQAGRSLVESGYSVASGAARWLVLLDALTAHSSRAA